MDSPATMVEYEKAIRLQSMGRVQQGCALYIETSQYSIGHFFDKMKVFCLEKTSL